MRLYPERPFFSATLIRKFLVSDQVKLGPVTCPGDASVGQGAECAQTEDKRRVAAGRRILTSASLRATSIMLPITMRESNVFQASLKYPWTEQAGGRHL